MNDRMQRLLDVFRSAEADVDASHKRLREASASRLAELLVLPPARRIQALHDPALTGFDRAALERSIEEAIPRRAVRVPRRWAVSGRSVRRWAWYYRRGLTRVALAAGPVGFCLSAALLHTPPKNAVPVVFAVPLTTTWAMPDGSSLAAPEPDPAGTEAVWFRKGATGTLRRWFPGRGYGTISPVPEDLLTSGEVVLRQTLDAVPPRSLM